MFTQSEDETDPLGQDGPNSAPATQRAFNQSHIPATQRTFNQSSSPGNQCTANQSSKSTSPLTVTLPKNKETDAKLDDERQNEKEKGQCSIQREQYKPEKGQ